MLQHMHLFRLLAAVFLAVSFIRPIYSEVTVEEVKQAVLKELDARRTSADSSAFNPAMGLVLDAVVKDTKEDKGGFDFRGAELNFQATVDPFAKVYAIINGTDEEVEVEEAAVVTTALPAHMTVRFGRYFSNFGRLPKFHEHELPFVERLTSLDSFVGGETKSDGVELTHLFYVPFFLQGTVGATNKIGSENTRLEETGGDGDTSGRKWNAMTYNARLFTYLPLGDNQGVDVGVSEAYTPRQNFIGGIANDMSNNRRYLTGVDITYRYEPVRQNLFKKITWGLEGFHNNERRRQELALDTDADNIGDTDTFERRSALGGYSYVEAALARLFSGGGFYDYSESIDNPDEVTRSAGGFINFIPSEFQRIRAQYSQVKDNVPGTETDHQVFLQWTAVIGKHAHAFKDR